jgi:hypothetical protein
MSTPAAAATTPSVSSPDVAAKLAFAEKQTVFYYTEIVELYDPSTGVRTPIQISGVDSTTRTGALQAIERLRTKSSPATSDVDIQFVTRVALTSQDAGDDAISRTQTLLRTEYDASTPGTPSASFNVLLDNLRFSIQNLPVDFNIRGDLDIVPKLEAIPLFESYEQATRYNARPICSLEEYITFLGDRGVRVAPIEPNSDTDGARLFPVKYYVQIKQYRDGPPPIVPTTNITNTELVTSPSGSDAVSSGTENAVVQGLPADFPETRSNWTDILLQYRQRVLTELPPRS